jgi:hypothetical protein
LNTIPGLYHVSSGLDAHMSMFVRWAFGDVKSTTNGQITIYCTKLDHEKKPKLEKRTAKHESYMQDMSTQSSPAGKYLIPCPDIVNDWSEPEKKRKTNIRAGKEADIYEAQFGFHEPCERVPGQGHDTDQVGSNHIIYLKWRQYTVQPATI